MIGPTNERTLVPALLPPGPTNINTCFVISFSDVNNLLLFSSLCMSIVFDFMAKTSGKTDARHDLLASFGLPDLNKRHHALLSLRTLRLNCLTTHYADLWQECWDTDFASDSFTKDDPRLGSWSHLTKDWHRHCAARTPFERRQCLVELDALAALALNLTAEELCTIYRVQFPILHRNERETYYDQRGMIVFTTNRGLSGVGLPRKEWEEIKNAQPNDLLPEYAQQYIPPFTNCDREEDMTLAYEVFRKRLEDQS